MKDERLTALGISLLKAFRKLIMGYATSGWLEDYFSMKEDLQELRRIETEAQQFIRIGFDFADLETALMSGFFPADLVEFNNEAEAHHVFRVGYESAALEEWLTLGFVPTALAEFNSKAGERVTEKGPTVSSWFPEENQRVANYQFQTSGEMNGDRNGREEASHSEEESRPQWMPEHRSSVRGLKDLARLLESEHGKGRASVSEVAHSRQKFESFGDAVGLSHFGKTNSPDSLIDFSLASTPSDDLGATFRRPSHNRGSSKERLSSIPRPEEEDTEETNLLPLDNYPRHPESRDVGILKGQGLKMPEGASHFDTQEATAREESSRDLTMRGNLSPSSPLQKQGRDRDVETQPHANEVHEHVKSPNDVAEVDLDLILRAIAQEIHREYKRFYGR